LVVANPFDIERLSQPSVTPNGKYLYVPYIYDRKIVMLNAVSGKITGSPIPVGFLIEWTQISPDGNTLYVSNAEDNTISVIDTTPQ